MIIIKEAIHTASAPAAIGPYSQAIRVGEFLFTSGQIPLDPVTGEFPQGGIEVQARQAFRNLQAVLEAGGASMDKVLKTTVFLANMKDFAAVNGIYSEFFTGVFPARSAVEVSALPKGALIEIEAIAALS